MAKHSDSIAQTLSFGTECVPPQNPESAQARREILKSGGVIARPTQTIRSFGGIGGGELKMMAAEQLWSEGEEGRNAHNVNYCNWRGERKRVEERTLFFVVAHIKDDGRLENAICIN